MAKLLKVETDKGERALINLAQVAKIIDGDDTTWTAVYFVGDSKPLHVKAAAEWILERSRETEIEATY